MRERATVLKTAGKIAVLQIEKSPACEGCRICAFKAGKSRVKVKALNTAGAKKGDTVIVQAEKDNRTLASFFAYIVPVLLAGAGVLIGALCKLEELYIVLLCLGGLALGFGAVFAIDKLLARSGGFGMEVAGVCPAQPEGAKGAAETDAETAENGTEAAAAGAEGGAETDAESAEEQAEEKTEVPAVSEEGGGAHTIRNEEETEHGKDL